MRIVVIHGPMRTGKTLHASKFAAHYGCTRTIDWTHAKQHEQPRDGDLLLTNARPTKILRAYSDAVLVPVNAARLAIGLAEVPEGGFPIECEWEREDTVAERCTLIADQVVPKYRKSGRPYSCGGVIAHQWQAAWDAACIALGGDPASYLTPIPSSLPV